MGRRSTEKSCDLRTEALIISPFRRPTFRKAISSRYPGREPWDSPPLAVASSLEKAGLSVTYLALQNILDAWDERHDLSRLRDMLSSVTPRLAIIATDYFIPSRSTATIYGTKIICRELRRLHPQITIGAGGRLATVAGRQFLAEVPDCDFLIHGEPESVAGNIVREVIDLGLGKASHPSLVTRQTLADGVQPTVATTATLDETPAPAWHLLETSIAWWDKIHAGAPPAGLPFSLRTSAGCRFQCRFCAGVPNWLNYRMKSAGRVASELDALTDAVGTRARVSFLEDEIFTRNPEHVLAVSDVFVARKHRVDGVYTHSSMLTGNTSSALARMAKRVYLGLDNANDSILRDMRKGQRFDTVLAAVDTALAAGLETHLEWIIGSPSEPLESLFASLNAIVSLLATGTVQSINTYVYCPHPGTEYAENAEAFGMRVIEGYDQIQESGGYPAYETDRLTQQQVFVAYLMSQLAISEVASARAHHGAATAVGTLNQKELRRIFSRFGRCA
jgi:anaerobic magnesium-protoporphyrin IX monomethyl ester cyclase